MQNEDDFIWHEAVKDVQKLEQPRPIKSEKKRTVRRIEKQETPVIYKNYHHTIGLNVSSDIDKNTLKRFKRGEFGIEATLDLHGMTMDKAYKAVQDFVISSYKKGRRAIIIITGKGLSHENEDIFEAKGVLKQSVPQWLHAEPLTAMILTYIHPSEKLGGQGALYILLRRKR